MKQINDDFHLISEKFLKDVLRQPPLDPDYWWKQKKSTSLKGAILITIEELREIWDHSACSAVDELIKCYESWT